MMYLGNDVMMYKCTDVWNIWTFEQMIEWLDDLMTNHLNDLMTEWLIIQLIDGLATYSAEKDIGCKKNSPYYTFMWNISRIFAL